MRLMLAPCVTPKLKYLESPFCRPGSVVWSVAFSKFKQVPVVRKLEALARREGLDGKAARGRR